MEESKFLIDSLELLLSILSNVGENLPLPRLPPRFF